MRPDEQNTKAFYKHAETVEVFVNAKKTNSFAANHKTFNNCDLRGIKFFKTAIHNTPLQDFVKIF
jgi:hypothetical protein